MSTDGIAVRCSAGYHRERPIFASFSTTVITTASPGSDGCRARRIRLRASSSVRIHFVTGRMPGRIRHVALVQRGTKPACVLYRDWRHARARDAAARSISRATGVRGAHRRRSMCLQPETAYECTNLPQRALRSRRYRDPCAPDSRPVCLRGERPRLPVLFDLRRAGHCCRRNHRAFPESEIFTAELVDFRPPPPTCHAEETRHT